MLRASVYRQSTSFIGVIITSLGTTIHLESIAFSAVMMVALVIGLDIALRRLAINLKDISFGAVIMFISSGVAIGNGRLILSSVLR
jgi:hypothetical protein